MKYYRPESLEEYREVVAASPGASLMLLAGGTDIMPGWEQEKGSRPDLLLDIKRIDVLRGIREKDDEIIIGAMTTVQELKNAEIIRNEFTALFQAASQFAGVQIRHRATVGGNVCHASPAGDLLPGLYAHEAEVQLVGPSGARRIPISELITGPGKTVLKPGEILTEIHLKRGTGKSLFYKLGLRQTMAIAVVNFAMVYSVNDSARFTTLHIAAGSVAPTVVFLRWFTQALTKNIPLNDALPLVDKDISPVDDIRGTADYRRTVLKNVLKYTLRQEGYK